MSDEKDNIVQLFKDNSTPPNSNSNKINVSGNNNVTFIGDPNGDIQINIVTHKSPPKAARQSIELPPNAISEAQAFKIKTLIDKIVEKEVAGGKPIGKAYSKWWTIFRREYEITRYQALPKSEFNSAINFLQQYSAIKRSKLKNKSSPTLKKELIKSIQTRRNQIGMSRGQMMTIVEEKIGKKVISISKLSEASLTKLYNIIFSLN